MTTPEVSETQPLYPEIGLMEDYEYPPYSFIDSPELVNVHQLMLAYCVDMDDLATLGWLSDLDQTEPHRHQFTYLSDNSPLVASHMEDERLKETAALHLYTAAKAECLLRIQSVREPAGIDNGVSRMVSNALAKLSNAYRIQYMRSPDKPHTLLTAHNLAMYALRFKAPDASGYRQTLGHWLHLTVDLALPWNHSEENFRVWEENLRLAIALTELGRGPQASYVGKCLVPDLVQLFELTDQKDETQKILSHFENIPIAEDEEPGLV